MTCATPLISTIVSLAPGAARPLLDRHVARRGGDAGEPALDGGEGGEVEAALAGDMGVGVERDVADAIAVGDEERVVGEAALHHAQGGVALLGLARKLRLAQRVEDAV